MRKLITFILATVPFLVPALLPAVISHAQNVDLGTDAQREAGRVLYEQKCAHCHGVDGIPPDYINTVLRPAPRNFTSGVYKFRTTANGELPSDEDIKNSIRDGMPYTAMPPWPSLSEQEITNLMYHIKTFSDDFAGIFGEVASLELPDPLSMTEETIARGRVVYEENQCANCHGERGLGDGPSAPTLEDQWGFPIRAADLTKRWTYRGGGTRGDIYQTFTTGLDGSPMPSYEIDPLEDQWALVDYVYSLSRDEADYATSVTATYVDGDIDLAKGAELFASADAAYFPIVGQVIEPGRSFFPGVNGIEVSAVYSASHVAFMLKWNDMASETVGSNAPDMSAPLLHEDDSDTTLVFSDAVAIQFPTTRPAGSEMPYFLFGDGKLSVDLWYADLASSGATHFRGRGANNLVVDGPALDISSSYEDGAWTVTFRRERSVADHIVFDEGTFVPVAFSVWDGFNRERGNRRGLTNWFYLYVDVAVKESPVVPMMTYGFATLLLGLGITFLVRRRTGRS